MQDHQLPPRSLERYPGFHSFKSSAPVRYPHRWQRDPLIQAALDPTVTAIGPLVFQDWSQTTVEFGFRVTIGEQDFALLVTDHGNSLGADLEVPILRIARSALAAEPLRSAARAVWSRKRLVVDPVARYRAIEQAATSIDGVVLDTLLKTMETPLPAGINMILAMLAQGILSADLSYGLSGRTKLRLGQISKIGPSGDPVTRLRALLSSQ